MGKNRQRGNPKQLFQQINEKLQEKQFSAAAAILRRAKFPPQDKKKADQLNVDIHYFWALDYFEKKDYLQAITTLRMFTERFKKKINVPLEKADMLVGLCYFYTNDFVKAASYLESSKSKSATHPFCFYYLLTLIYQKKYATFAALEADYEKELSLLSAEKKSFLPIAIALVQSNFAEAITLLSAFNSDAKKVRDNVDGLLAISEGRSLETTKNSLKPLYKFFLALPLSDEEKAYLNKIPAFKEQVKNLKNNQLQEQLALPLQKLCEGGQSLTLEKFEQCMELPEEYRPYIVYNQVVALFHEGLEETEEEIVYILKKYEWHFFQIPEAIFLFAQIIYWDPDNFSSNFFWKNIEASLDRFGKSFTPLQLSRLSWRISGCFEGHGIEEKIYTRKQNKLATNYPQMLGMKWWQITESIFAPDSSLPDSALDIFTYANFHYGSGIAKDKWEDDLEGMYPNPEFISLLLAQVGMDDYMISDDLIEKHMDTEYKKTLEKAQNVLVRIVTEHEVHLKNKVVLDLFKMTNHAMNKFEKDREIILNQAKKEQFFKAYYKMIVLFEEDQPDSEFMQDYQLLENAPKINRLTQVVKKQEKGKELVDLFQQYLADGDSSIIHQVLLDDLRYTRLIEGSLHAITIYFRILIDRGGDEFSAIVQQFGNLYVKKLRLPYVPNYPDTNFFIILKNLMKEGVTPNHILTVSTLTELYLPFLTRVVEPLYYNAAEKVLSYFLKAKKKHPNFNFNQTIIDELIVFVEKAVEERKLKKLGATLTEAKKVF